MLTRLRIYLRYLVSDKKKWLMLLPAICKISIISWILFKSLLYYFVFVKKKSFLLNDAGFFALLMIYALLELPFTIIPILCMYKNYKEKVLFFSLFIIQFLFIYAFFLWSWSLWAFGISGLLFTIGD